MTLRTPAILLLLASSPALARPPRPQLTDAARALLGKGGLFLVPQDNLALPLVANGKPVPFFAPAPQRLEVISAAPTGEALLLADGDAYRVRGDVLELVAPSVGAQAAASADGKVLAGIEDKKLLKITLVGGAPRMIKYKRPGRWELERPYLSPDGAWTLVTLRDFSNPNLDELYFLAFETRTGVPEEEIALSKSFVPGVLRQPLDPGQVLIQMQSQSMADDGVPVLTEAGLVVFDFKTRKLTAAPPSVRPGLASAKGRYTLLPGPPVWGDGRQCSGDESQVFDGTKRPSAFRIAEGSVVSGLDFLPDERALIAAVVDLKGCKSRGVLIPLAGDVAPAKWPPFALPPLHDGKISGRVIHPLALPAKAP
ncbi:MAG: hypothetical protein EXR72_22105 [Myxococcales bacterium]|nr:hypothetical protein [Myxococcales bacterium]